MKLIDFAVLYAVDWSDTPKTLTEILRRMDRGLAWDAILCYPPAEKASMGSRRGHIRNIVVKNLQVVAGALPYSVISGFDEGHEVKDVTIQNLTYQGRPLLNAAAAHLVEEYAMSINIRAAGSS